MSMTRAPLVAQTSGQQRPLAAVRAFVASLRSAALRVGRPQSCPWLEAEVRGKPQCCGSPITPGREAHSRRLAAAVDATKRAWLLLARLPLSARASAPGRRARDLAIEASAGRRYQGVVVYLLPLLLAASLPALAACSSAAEYPAKPVQMVLMDPAGGPTDQVARLLIEAAKPYFPQPIAPIARPGGAGTVAAVEVVQAAPDGYTIGLQAVGAMALQPHRSDLPYKTVDDYRPVINLVYQPLVFAVKSDTPWHTMAELIEHAKTNPGQVRVGIPGAGTIAQINLDLLAEQSGAKFNVVPFNGASDLIKALLTGDVAGAVVGPPGLVSPAQTGMVRVLAAFEAKRDLAFPDAPTFRELGYDITLGGYFFIIAPKGTPDAIVQRLHDAFKQALETESFRQAAGRAGFVLDYMGPADLTRRLQDDYLLFGRMVGRQ